MPCVRSRMKAMVGGYFDAQLIASVKRCAEALGMTVTDFVRKAYTDGLDEDEAQRQAKQPRSLRRTHAKSA